MSKTAFPVCKREMKGVSKASVLSSYESFVEEIGFKLKGTKLVKGYNYFCTALNLGKSKLREITRVLRCLVLYELKGYAEELVRVLSSIYTMYDTIEYADLKIWQNVLEYEKGGSLYARVCNNFRYSLLCEF